uniref:Uromodulin n=1 Tax=Dicentrarchus labrax TaxID=13489 RepID=E6ZI12_DICLA|nr:Uromodulin [Dicentrarchus labrax]
MVVLAVAVFVTLSSCAVGCSGSPNSTELKLWSRENQSMAVQIAAVFKYYESARICRFFKRGSNIPVIAKNAHFALLQEMESLRCEQTTLQQQQNALTQMHITSHQKRAQKEVAGTNVFTYGSNDDEEDLPKEDLPEEDSRRRGDPCFHHTVLDQAWRATNSTSKFKMCDRNVKWKGWYRLFYKGRSIQMPERCVPVNKCGTHSPLWLVGRHPKRRQGIVTRNVCGHWKKNCCAFRSTPIQVKKCRGNYYVYKFNQPSSCYLAYCAVSSKKIHFFASYPGQLSGKVNRIKYSKVLVNVGRAYNRRTGVFKAPVKGVYQFFFSTQSANAGQKTDLWLVINSYWVAVSHTHVSRPSTVGSLSMYMTFLRRGAKVFVTHNSGRSWANAASMTITFGGSLLVQMK